MERIYSQDDRIRRAEEIYARRQNLRERTKRATLNVSNNNKNLKLLKRLVLQIIICLLIYLIFYLINTTDYSFSKEALGKTEELISSDADFMSIYQSVANWMNEYISSLNTQLIEENKIEENNIVENNNVNEEQSNVIEPPEEMPDEQEKNQESQGEDMAFHEEETTWQKEIQDVNLSETDRIKQEKSFAIPLKRNHIFGIWRKRSNIKHNVYIS